MIDCRIHVRVEAIPRWSKLRPSCQRLLFDKSDFCNGLHTLEPILPRNNKSQGGSILSGAFLAVDTDRYKGEFIHSLIYAQPFRVGPIQDWSRLPGHSIGRIESLHLDVFGR